MVRLFEARSRSELLATRVNDLYPDPSERQRISLLLLERGEIVGHEQRLKTLTGRPIWVSVTTRVHTDIDGQVYFDGIIEDIGERKAQESLRNSHDFLNSLFESIQDGVSVHTPDLTVRMANRAMRMRYLGDDGQLIQHQCDPCYRTAQPPCLDCPVERCFATGEPTMVTQQRSYRGKPHWFEISAYPVRAATPGQVDHVIKFIRDITDRKQMELALRQSEKAIRDVLDQTKVQMWAFDGEHYKYINRELSDYLGLPDGAPLTITHWTDNLHPDDLETATAIWLRHWQDKTAHDNHFRLRRHDGIYRDFYCHAVPILAEDGQFSHFQGFNVDITDRKRAEAELAERERHYREMVEAAGDSFNFYMLSPAGAILYISSSAQRLFGIGPTELIGQAWVDIAAWTADSLAWGTEAIAVCAAGDVPPPVPLTYTLADEQRHLVTYPRPVKDGHGQVIKIEGITVDLTARLRMEARLREALFAAEAANRAKSTFIANMSHELRTPLNAILGYARLLKRDPALSPEQRQAVTTIEHGGDYLLVLINDLLDLAKIEAGHFELAIAPCELSTLFRQLAEVFRPCAEQQGIAFHWRLSDQLPQVVDVDERRLQQVCMNLLGNALKFTVQGRVQLVVDYDRHWLTIAVEDTGIGIEQEHLPQLFQPFVQNGDITRKQQGSGLGLAISQGLVQEMGGAIEAQSQAGEGSRFSFSIPAPASQVPPRRSELTQAASAQVVGYCRDDGVPEPLTILVVDDEASHRGVLRGLLKGVGFRILEAGDGREALAMVANGLPDLILMDIAMPDIGGLEVTRQILAQHPQLPIIAVSARAFTEDHNNSLSAGCRGHLAKPVDIQALWDHLADCLALTWRSQAVQPTATPPALPSIKGLRDELQALPAVLRKDLATAIIRGQGQGIQQVLSQIEQHNGHLAKVLRQTVANYEYETLLMSLEGDNGH